MTDTTIPAERVLGLVTTAFEGGVGYWAVIVGYEAPPTPPEQWEHRSFEESLGQPKSKEHPVFRHSEYPLNGGAVLVAEDEAFCRAGGIQEYIAQGGEVWRLDAEAVERGLALMAKTQPRHWANFVEENEDADTGDVFMQLALLGEVIYG
jgi:hypothetical protein